MVISSPTTGPLVCPRCGTPTVPGGRFCFNCGLRFTQTDTPRAEAAERRVVTVLFGDLSDFTAWAEDRDPERVGEVTDRVLAALAREVDEVGGRVDNLSGDGIMAVFGAPTAHEDDPERAVRAAAAMQETARRLIKDEGGDSSPLGLRVGVNTGEVLAGVQAALSYTVIGDTVNTAARLSGAAAVGTVYAGRDTVTATRSVATWRDLPPLVLKGKREPVPAYELVSLRPSNIARPGLADDATFIGREQELAELSRYFAGVVDAGQPDMAVVIGEAGIGKTRLARELAETAEATAGATVLWGRTVRHGDVRDLAPLIDLIRGACGITDGDTLDRVADRVRRTVAGLTHPIFETKLPSGIGDRLLGMLGVPPDRRPSAGATTPPGDPVGRASHGEAVQRAADDAVETVGLLLSALAVRNPVLVVVDDLEWATSRLTTALRRLTTTLNGPVMLVLLDRESPQFSDLVGARRIALSPLPESAARALLKDYLGEPGLSRATQAELLARVHGNPFFLTELLNLLVDRGLLHQVPDPGGEGMRWVLEGSLAATVLPAGVQSVLAARIDDLDAAAKAALRAAAVLGPRFPAEALQVVGERPAAEVERALSVLTERQLVRPPRQGETLWRFVHPMARDVAYSGLPKVERARRHATAARWGVTAMIGSSREVSTFVATHALRAYDLAASMALPAGDPAWSAREAGFHAHVRLARSALARDDHRAAADLLADARRLGRGVIDGDDDINVRILHAEALVWLRRLDEAERTLRPALRVNVPSRRAAAYAVLGELRQKQGRGEEARQSLITALEAAHRAGDDRAVAAALRRLGLLEYAAGRIQAAEERYREALSLARRVDDPRGVGWALQHLAWSATTRGDYAKAERTLREASAVFERLEDAGGLGWCSGTEALVLLLSGQLTRTRKVSRVLINLAESMRERWGQAVCLTIDAVAAAELGDIETAESEAARAAELFTETGDSWGRTLTLIARGLAARGAGRPRRGADLLTEACAEAASTGHVLIGAFAQVLLGLTRLDAGEVDAAEEAARRALADLDRLELRPHAQLGAKVLVAQIARARGRLDEAITELRGALSASEPATLMFPRRQAYAHLAGTLLDAGEPDEALRVARQAVGVDAEDVRAQVLAYRALGTVLAAHGDVEGSREAYEQALAAATATGAVSEAPQTRRLLAALPGSAPEALDAPDGLSAPEGLGAADGPGVADGLGTPHQDGLAAQDDLSAQDGLGAAAALAKVSVNGTRARARTAARLPGSPVVVPVADPSGEAVPSVEMPPAEGTSR
ncbi:MULTISPECIES: tetratricopeptide repeat protein [unclassified Parafrankia]|uniref:tetratricopeptide repeat protein n=1 Tax=unclassified Parafrankia TaxID=2994368 RepID=UPI000DA57A00|nr:MULTISPECIES: tetratricopeptide repeat protein [unclassified Parafrankia]TCJ40663.1 tetratricopeptide repeat protein [Parafrankia sp. BMG5.11]SQD99216.1 Adenylate/guanylate cyclase with TPR repeats [Parafrankia sp. Ea1.12]